MPRDYALEKIKQNIGQTLVNERIDTTLNEILKKAKIVPVK